MNTQFVGKGAFGVVRKASNNTVIKTFESSQECFTEYSILILLKNGHDNIVKLIDSTPKTLVLEYCGKKNVMDCIETLQLATRRTRTNIIEQLLDGLRYIHSCDIAHSDIKDGNIVYDSVGDTYKYIDFGMSYVITPHTKNDTQCTSENDTVLSYGCEYYTSPSPKKSARGNDLWALGIVLLRWFTVEKRDCYDFFDNVERYYTKHSFKYTKNIAVSDLLRKLLEFDDKKRADYFV